MRKSGLDFLKLFCSFLVVCIHRPFPEPTGAIATAIASMAVPVFFMITGYFYSVTKDHHKEIPQIKKIGSYFLYANVLFFFLKLGDFFLEKKTVLGFFRDDFAPNALWTFLFLNESPFHGHLWYLGAILYVLVIVFWVDRFWGREKLYPVIPVLLITGLLLGNYSLLVLGKEFSSVLSRNFIFLGLTYFLIGDLLSKFHTKCKSRNLLWLAVLFAMLILLERYLLDTFNMNTAANHYLGTAFLALFAFLAALNSADHSDNRFYKWCCFAGSKLSLNIYILHPIFAAAFVKAISFVNNVSIKTVLRYSSPFLVFGLSIVTSWVIYMLGEQVKKRSH